MPPVVPETPALDAVHNATGGSDDTNNHLGSVLSEPEAVRKVFSMVKVDGYSSDAIEMGLYVSVERPATPAEIEATAKVQAQLDALVNPNNPDGLQQVVARGDDAALMKWMTQYGNIDTIYEKSNYDVVAKELTAYAEAKGYADLPFQDVTNKSQAAARMINNALDWYDIGRTLGPVNATEAYYNKFPDGPPGTAATEANKLPALESDRVTVSDTTQSPDVKVSIVVGDITAIKADTIIAAVNKEGMWLGGVDGAIQRKNGEFYGQAFAQISELQADKAVVTKPSEANKDKTVFGGVVFVPDEGERPLHEIVRQGLEAADKSGATSATLPAFRTGVVFEAQKQTLQDIGKEIKQGIDEFIASKPENLKDIKLVIYDPKSAPALIESTAYPESTITAPKPLTIEGPKFDPSRDLGIKSAGLNFVTSLETSIQPNSEVTRAFTVNDPSLTTSAKRPLEFENRFGLSEEGSARTKGFAIKGMAGLTVLSALGAAVYAATRPQPVYQPDLD